MKQGDWIRCILGVFIMTVSISVLILLPPSVFYTFVFVFCGVAGLHLSLHMFSDLIIERLKKKE